MREIDNLTKPELINLLDAYDKYIQEANDDNKYVDGWYPVSIEEFYNNDYVFYL